MILTTNQEPKPPAPRVAIFECGNRITLDTNEDGQTWAHFIATCGTHAADDAAALVAIRPMLVVMRDRISAMIAELDAGT